MNLPMIISRIQASHRAGDIDPFFFCGSNTDVLLYRRNGRVCNGGSILTKARILNGGCSNGSFSCDYRYAGIILGNSDIIRYRIFV